MCAGIYVLTEKGERLLDELSGAERDGKGNLGKGPEPSTPPRPSHQMFTNALRCPACGTSGFVADARELSGGYWTWTFHCTDKCGDRTYQVTEIAP